MADLLPLIDVYAANSAGAFRLQEGQAIYHLTPQLIEGLEVRPLITGAEVPLWNTEDYESRQETSSEGCRKYEEWFRQTTEESEGREPESVPEPPFVYDYTPHIQESPDP